MESRQTFFVSLTFGERQRVEVHTRGSGVFLSKAIQNQPLEIWGMAVSPVIIYISAMLPRPLLGRLIMIAQSQSSILVLALVLVSTK